MSVPSPDFKVFSDGTITPETGTAGSHSRTGSIWKTTSESTISEVSSGPCENVVAPGSERKGILAPGNMRNECQETITFENWDAIGSVSVSDNQTTAPDGNTTGAQVTGSAAGDGVKLTLVQSSEDFNQPYMNLWVYAKAVSGSPQIKFNITDSNSNEGTENTSEDGISVSDEWKLIRCSIREIPTSVASGSLIMHIIVDDGDVYLWGAGAQFCGANDTWDMNAICDYSPYKPIIGASRESINETTLDYTGSELTGNTVSKMTVSGMFYYPNCEPFYPGGNQYLWIAEKATQQKVHGLFRDITDRKLKAYIGSSSPTTVDIDPLLSSTGRWTQYALAIESGNSAVYFDGEKVLENSDTFSSFQLEGFYPGAESGAHDIENSRFMWPLAQMDVWMDKRLTDAEIKEHYENIISSDLLEPPHLFPIKDALEVWRFDRADVTTSVNKDTYTVTGSPKRLTQGPFDLKGTFFGNDEYASKTLGTELNIAADEDFVFLAQLRSWRGTQPAERVIFDFGTNYGTNQGFMLIVNATYLDFYVRDSSSTHVTRWAHNGLFDQESKIYTFRWVFDRSNSLADLYYKKEGETEVQASPSQVLTSFSSLGDIDGCGRVGKIGGRSNSGISDSYMDIFQLALSKDTNYDVKVKP